MQKQLNMSLDSKKIQNTEPKDDITQKIREAEAELKRIDVELGRPTADNPHCYVQHTKNHDWYRSICVKNYITKEFTHQEK